MPISFNQIPADSLVPFTFVEFDGSRAISPAGGFRSLLVGRRLAAGNVAANNPVQINTVSEAEVSFGPQSQLANMFRRFRQNSPLAECWCVAVDDVPAGNAATVELTVTGAPTASGEISLYIAGTRVGVPVDGSETVAETATAINTAITRQVATLPVTNAVNNAVVTLTHRHKGPIDVDVRFNYQAADIFPAGFTATNEFTAGTGQVAAADITAALRSLGEERFDLIAHAFADANTLPAIEQSLEFRWGPLLQVGGLAVGSYVSPNGTQQEASAFGNARNSRFSCVLGHGKIPTPSYEFAASVVGAIHQPVANDPARPLQTIELRGVLPPEVQERWDINARNTALGDGIATVRPSAGGVVRIERLVTTYQQSPAGVADASFRDANTPLTLQWIRRDWRDYFAGKYSRHKLADDGTRFADGQPVMTPSLGRAEAIGKFREWESLALVEDAEAFKAGLVVVRNTQDRNRLDFLMTPDLVNQLRVTAVQIGFLL